MAIIVEEKEQVLKVHVSPKGVRPDPVVARTGDIICWMWPKHILSSISEAGNVKDEEEDEIFFSNRFVCYYSFFYFFTFKVLRQEERPTDDS